MEVFKVKDLMVPISEYATVTPDATLYDAVVALQEAGKHFERREYKHRSVLVLDEDGTVVGKLTALSLLKALEPKYEKVGDIESMSRFGWSQEFLTFMAKNFGLWEGSFQDLCAKAAGRKVKDMIIDPAKLTYIDQDASMEQAVHSMIMSQELSLLVTSDKAVVGVLRLIDVFETVCQAIRSCRI